METSDLEYFIETQPEETHDVPQIPPVSLRSTKVSTLKAAIPHAFLILSLIVMAVVFKATQIVFDGRCTSMSVLLLYQVALWLLALIIHHFYEVQHARLRIRGYQAFYKHLRTTSSYQFIILSWWNAFTVVYLVGSVTYALDTLCNWDVWYSAINLTIYSISIHGIVVLTVIIFYSRYVILFNKASHYASDIEAIEVWRRDVSNLVNTDVGLNEEVVRLVEKQAYLIEFYQNRIKDMNAWVVSRSEDFLSGA